MKFSLRAQPLRMLMPLALALGGCAVGPAYRPPAAPLVATFDAAQAADGQLSSFSAEPVGAQFWHEFKDPLLDELMTTALASNHDIRIALSRLHEARSLRRSAWLDFFPTITGAGAHTQALTPLTKAPGLTREQRESDTYDASFDARWEIDLFGRLRRGNEAARAETAAALAGWQFTQVTVAAEVTRNYLQLRGLQGQLAVATRNASNQRDTLALTDQRLEAGRGTELDSARARAQLNSTLANVPALQASVAQTIYQLSVLTGQVPAALKDRLLVIGELPASPAITHIGAPAELLRRRPDIRVAERQLAAATARIGVSVADFFPTVSFGARAGNSASSAQNLFSAPNDFFSFGPQLSWAFLDLAHVRARVVRARAGAERSLASYEQTVLRALQETESALVTFDRARRSSEYLQQAAAASESASSLARLRFDDGVADFLVVLDAERSVLDAQDRLVRSRTAEATALVAVYKALGGGWSEKP